MRLRGDFLVMDTTAEGRVVADCSDYVSGDGLAERYRSLTESDLPAQAGRLVSQEVLRVLRDVADSSILCVAGYINSTVAEGYLAMIEADGQPAI